MLLVVLRNKLYDKLKEEFPDKVNIIDDIKFKHINNPNNPEYLINYLEQIKGSMATFDVTIIYYSYQVITCLKTLDIEYKVVYMPNDRNKLNHKLQSLDCDKIEIKNYQDMKNILCDIFKWDMLDEQQCDEQKETNSKEITVKTDTEPIDKSKLTLAQLLDEDISITDNDVRDLKNVQNKLKVGMILQAKSMLNRVLKLSGILDKLYDELLDRIEDNIKLTDTASLMYTTEYISKALADTNQFIMSLINNEKIQNFFVIDNSKVINLNDNKVDIDKREKIRKAADIVLNNLDYFVEGDFNSVINPNTVLESEAEDSGDKTTKPV